MKNDNLKQAKKEEFIMLEADVIIFDTENAITTSGGGFIGDWDDINQ